MAAKIGLSVNLTDPAIIELAAWTGYDFVMLDCEQTIFPNLGELIRTAEAVSIESWVRVPRNEAATIGQVLNMGARCIVVPHIDSRSSAELAVRHSKFYPAGVRSWFSNARDARYGLIPSREYPALRNALTRLIVQIEDPKGIAAVEEILGVSGIDLVMTGPGDLAHGLGIPGRLDDERIQQAEHDVFRAAARHNIPVVHFADSAADLASIAARYDVQYLVAGSDVAGMLEFLKQRRNQFARTAPQGQG